MGLELKEVGKRIPHTLLVRLEALYDTLKVCREKGGRSTNQRTRVFYELNHCRNS